MLKFKNIVCNILVTFLTIPNCFYTFSILDKINFLMFCFSLKVKSAFTRTYNKESHMTPYSQVQGAKKGKKGRGGAGAEDGMLPGEEGEQESQDG